jgi:biopolymer transport protein ExbD
MAAISDGQVSLRKRTGMPRAKKHSLRVDMTPMVDLGFLLITFFVITARLTEPKGTDLNMPHDGPFTPVANSGTLTVLIGGDKILYYQGNWADASKSHQILPTSLDLKTGLGKIIREKQQYLDQHPLNGEGRTALMVLIKAGENANYSQAIEALDEMLINRVIRYALVKPSSDELAYLGTAN